MPVDAAHWARMLLADGDVQFSCVTPAARRAHGTGDFLAGSYLAARLTASPAVAFASAMARLQQPLRAAGKPGCCKAIDSGRHSWHPPGATEKIMTNQRHNALLGKPVAEEILRDAHAGCGGPVGKGWPVKLVSISVGDVAAVKLYVRNQARGAERAGIRSRNATAESVSRIEMLGILAALTPTRG